MKKRWIKIFLLLLLVPLALLVSVWVYHFRPLIQTEAWNTDATDDTGVALPTKTYRMLGRPGLIFINIRDADARHKWFAILTDDRRVMAASWPRNRPYLAFNHDQRVGIALGDAKLGEHWEVDWVGTQVTFTGNGIMLTASPTAL